MTPDLLAAAGIALFGPEWKRTLATALGPLFPAGPRDSLDPRSVQRWATGQKPIPPWVGPALQRLLLAEAEGLEEQARERRAVAEQIAG
ncbi:hypothetical protein [Methylobacterium flocculans]|uniref:hypothetical protein n=1 Tax=Methylobacterium flocculans TaxID=2984843 RepID=UPI00116F9C35|nr:hypothetical protein [Methylobacterium sp. FF17]GEL42921.1 hypothetical protein MEX01_35120 [Methylorubrum extorquens]